MPEPAVTHRIGHVSDSHFTVDGTMHGSIPVGERFADALEALRQSGLPLDLVVHTGDVADDGAPSAYVAAQRTARQVLDRTCWPMLWVPGNHDDRRSMRAGLLGIAADPAPLDSVFDVRGVRVVALDSSIPGHVEGAVDADRLEWLREQLREPAEHGTVIAMHHPPIPVDSTVFTRFRLTDRNDFGAAIAGSDVRAILAGHLHRATAGVIAGVPVYVAPSTAYTIRLTPPGGGVVGADGNRSAAVLTLFDDGSASWALLGTDPAEVVARVPEDVFADMGVDP